LLVPSCLPGLLGPARLVLCAAGAFVCCQACNKDLGQLLLQVGAFVCILLGVATASVTILVSIPSLSPQVPECDTLQMLLRFQAAMIFVCGGFNPTPLQA
jgi:hypothetical protein